MQQGNLLHLKGMLHIISLIFPAVPFIS